MRSKKEFKIVLTILIVLLVGISLFVFIMDPYQQYRKSDIYVGSQRLLNAGLIKNSDYNAVITGSSMAMNFYPLQVDSVFGWNSINLTVMGATSNDYKYLYKLLFETNKTKNVIQSVDFFSFINPDLPLELYLYDNNLLNDIRYLINYQSINDAISKLSKERQSKNEIYHFSSELSRKIVIEDYYKNINKKDNKKVSCKLMYNRFLRDYLPIIKKNKRVQFILYYPPYSILQFKLYKEKGWLNEMIQFKRMITLDLLQCDNVKLYDFQYCEALTMNLSDFMDISHHSHATNRKIISYIFNDSCRVTINNHKKNEDILVKQVNNYHIPVK